MSATATPDLAALAERADAQRQALAAHLAGATVDLPLRYWRQAAHFTTPASDAAMARKAVEGGTAPVGRMLERLGLTAADLAERLGVPALTVEAALDRPARAPLVMLDGEDAIAPGDDVATRAMQIAADVLGSADWRGDGPPTLRFFRPPGLAIGTTARALFGLLGRLAEAADGDPERFALDGIVMPKIDHPEEVDLLNGWLDEAEASIGLPKGRIRVAYLVESGWSAARLPEIGRRAAPRLCALIFGIADFSADLALPAIGTDHPLAQWCRAEIVAVAGALGVPAVDGMTLAYPVADPSLDAGANRTRFLDRMRLVYDDTLAARRLGMAGKWVGHPAQLFAVLLADEVLLSPATLEREAAKLEAYQVAVAADQGAAMIGGVMSDRATDRHARILLRRATAAGRFDPDRARALEVIDDAEADEVRGG